MEYISRWRGLLAAVLYGLLTVGMTWPVVTHMSSSVVGIGGDPWQTMWRFEEKAQLLTEVNLTNNTARFFYEEFLGGGEARLVNLSVWPWMWLQSLFGQPTAYNLVWLLSFWLSGLGIYYLVRFLVTQFSADSEIRPLGLEAGAFLAGVMYMFLPYHISHAMGHFGAMQMQWLPWILFLAVYWFFKPGIFKAGLLGLLLIAQAWTEHHYMLWLGVFAVVSVGYWWFGGSKLMIRERLSANRGVVITSVMLWAVAGGLIVASYWPTVRLAWEEVEVLSLGQEQLIRFSVDTFSFVAGSPWHPLWGELAYSIFGKHFTGNIFESVQFLGWLPLLLLVFFHQHIPRRTKSFWVLIMVIFGVMSLGPRLHVLGTVLPFPLPYALVDSWPVFSAVRTVARAGVMVGLSTAILFGWVLATQLRRWQSAVAILLIVLAEFLFFPVTMQSSTLPRVYERVAAASGKVVVELPAATNYALASRALYAENYHGKESIGNIALERGATEEQFLLGKQTPTVKQLLYLRTTDLREDRREFFGQELLETLPDALSYLEVSGIVAHKDSLSQLQLSSIDRFLTSAGMRSENIDDAAWYPVVGANWQGRPDGVIAIRGEGFSHVDFDPDEETTFVRVPSQATVSFINVSSELKRLRVRLKAAANNTGTADIHWQGENVGEFVADQFSFKDFELLLPPGEHMLEIMTTDGAAILLQDPHFMIIERV